MAFKITYNDKTTEDVQAYSYRTGQDGVWIEFLNQYDPQQILLVRADKVARIEFFQA